MIDLARIKQRPTKGRIALEFLLNAPLLLLILYGLKCIATQHGKMLLSGSPAAKWSWHLVPVHGNVASMAGWAYVGIGLFLYLSDGSPPGENRVWLWRMGRILLRWGGLAVALYCFAATDNQVLRGSFDFSILPPYLLGKIGAFIGGFIALMLFLSAMLQREQVKRDLEERICRPLHIWWIPAAYWVPWRRRGTAFRVTYADRADLIHRGYCCVYRSLLKDSRWGSRRVNWLTDTVIHPLPAPEV